jgi:putative RNA 2'-phosphotransferase
MNAQGKSIDRVMLEEIVENNSKQRFAFSEDKSKIRANQGHSVAVDLEFTPAEPPTLLYHGTAERFLASIMKQGVQKRSRQHVHLSKDKVTAVMVGKRHGKAVVLIVEAGKMYKDGYEFYHSENGYWLTDHIPTQYLKKQAVD